MNEFSHVSAPDFCRFLSISKAGVFSRLFLNFFAHDSKGGSKLFPVWKAYLKLHIVTAPSPSLACLTFASTNSPFHNSKKEVEPHSLILIKKILSRKLARFSSLSSASLHPPLLCFFNLTHIPGSYELVVQAL